MKIAFNDCGDYAHRVVYRWFDFRRSNGVVEYISFANHMYLLLSDESTRVSATAVHARDACDKFRRLRIQSPEDKNDVGAQCQTVYILSLQFKKKNKHPKTI